MIGVGGQGPATGVAVIALLLIAFLEHVALLDAVDGDGELVATEGGGRAAQLWSWFKENKLDDTSLAESRSGLAGIGQHRRGRGDARTARDDAGGR